MEQSFFYPSFAESLGTCSACFREAMSGCPVQRLLERRGSPGSHHTQSMHCFVDPFGFICSFLLCYSSYYAVSPPSSSGWCMSSPCPWCGEGLVHSLAQSNSTPALPLPSSLVLPPNTRFLTKVLGKGLMRQQHSVSAEHICFQEPWGVKQK